MKPILLAAALALALPSAARAEFRIRSTDLAAGRPIPQDHVLDGFGCTGGNRSPGLSWSGAPVGTRSFAVTVYDPDAPTGSGWWHWVVFNLPGTTDHLDTDASRLGLPAGAIQSATDFGKAGYGGPCPPAGAKPHRYVFTVHALKVDSLPLDASASGAMVGYMLGQNALATARLTATLGR